MVRPRKGKGKGGAPAKKVPPKPIYVEITDQQLLDIKAAFQLFDRENMGQIIRNEVGPALRVLNLNPDDSEVQAILTKLDPDATGVVDYEPFAALAVDLLKEMEVIVELIEAFRCLDKDGDGEIINEEIIECLTTMGDVFNPDEMKGFITMADPDGRGQFKFDTFVMAITKK